MVNEKPNTPAPMIPSQALARLSEFLGEEPGRVARLIKSVLKVSKKGAEPTPEELAGFCIVCAQHGLNPITKEIHGFVSQGGQIIPIVGIDGWFKIVNAHRGADGKPDFNGHTIAYDYDAQGKIAACTVNIFVKGREHPSPGIALMSESRRNTPTWNSHPSRMLFVRAFCYAARAAFGLGNIYDPDDGEAIIQAEIASQSPPTSAEPSVIHTGNAGVREALRKRTAVIPPEPNPLDPPATNEPNDLPPDDAIEPEAAA